MKDIAVDQVFRLLVQLTRVNMQSYLGVFYQVQIMKGLAVLACYDMYSIPIPTAPPSLRQTHSTKTQLSTYTHTHSTYTGVSLISSPCY